MSWVRENLAPWASILTLIAIALGGWLLRQVRGLVNGRLTDALTRISQLEQTIRENGYARSDDLPGGKHSARPPRQSPRRRRDD